MRGGAPGLDVDVPSLPDYEGACVCNVVPALLDPTDEPPPWLPAPAVDADRVVLLVLDGVGWHQLVERRHLAPTLAAMAGGAIQTVLPTTTATALTSIATGTTPGEHGVVGYRISVEGEVLNVLRWSTRSGDARTAIRPSTIQSIPAFLDQRPPAVTRAEFSTSGFSGAHLAGVRFRGWRMASSLVTEIRMLTAAGEPFVYAYYDGVDKVAHEYGLGPHYDAELAAADRLVAEVLDAVPRGTTVVVTADHGQVDTGDDLHQLDGEVLGHVGWQSGEARFRWLHARSGRSGALLEAAIAKHGDRAWVRTRDEIVDAGWFGPKVSSEARARLGDVALVARGTAAFLEPSDSGPYHLIGRHGSATPAELDVPLLAARA
ncbi:MAG: alkaline phosphatase family protein [Actinomycetota bacterium]|nr:alkaline phosphatase family protein [Acidimicrobiia bacterium]MDQ3293394.1 alkaline phosphatase family protein [Actinomycetota bacterium]